MRNQPATAAWKVDKPRTVTALQQWQGRQEQPRCMEKILQRCRNTHTLFKATKLKETFRAQNLRGKSIWAGACLVGHHQFLDILIPGLEWALKGDRRQSLGLEQTKSLDEGPVHDARMHSIARRKKRMMLLNSACLCGPFQPLYAKGSPWHLSPLDTPQLPLSLWVKVTTWILSGNQATLLLMIATCWPTSERA